MSSVLDADEFRVVQSVFKFLVEDCDLRGIDRHVAALAQLVISCHEPGVNVETLKANCMALVLARSAPTRLAESA